MGLVFRSVGYRGVPLPGVPFHESWGVILNEKGRVLDPERKQPIPGEYAAGWIKRGPTGVIGTNKPDAAETVAAMLDDAGHGRVPAPGPPRAGRRRGARPRPPAPGRLLRRLAPTRRGGDGGRPDRRAGPA